MFRNVIAAVKTTMVARANTVGKSDEALDRAQGFGLSGVQYGVRGLDVALDFKLPLISVLFVVGLLVGFVLFWVSRKKPPGAEAT